MPVPEPVPVPEAAAAVQEPLPLELPEEHGYQALPPVEFAEPLDGPVRYTTAPSPIGKLLLSGDGESLTGVYMLPEHRHGPVVGADWQKDPHPFVQAVAQLDAYFAGRRAAFDLRLAPQGSTFQLRVWRALTTIPYGRTTSYGRIAADLGRPNASRAVGMANGRNPISIIVPCHRVIGSDGSLTGYGGGLARKQQLLALEQSGRR